MFNFSSWLSSLRRALRPRTAPRRRFRPGVEGLEVREVPAVFTVTTTADTGAGSLRDAIRAANAHPNANGVPDQIRFHITGPASITLQTALTAVTDAVVIDGTTQPGAGGRPAVEINGQGSGGLVLLNHSGSTVKGLIINRVAGAGLTVIGGGGHTVTGNFIGTGADGATDLGNIGDGVLIAQSRGNTVSFNVISGNGGNGVELHGSAATGNTLKRNMIGVNAAGTAALGNDKDGVLLVSGASGNLIANGVISANKENGIELRAHAAGNVIRGNKIGTDAGGTVDLGNGAQSDDGVHVDSSDGNVIGGLLPGQGNLISGNGDDGVEVFASAGVRVEGNRIGTTANGLGALGNDFGVFLTTARNALVRNNVISANTFEGVLIDDGAVGNRVQGNLIGLGANGTTPLGNGNAGVEVDDARNNLIGGTTPGQRNVISANEEEGVLLDDGGSGNVVRGNFIGTDRSGSVDRGNAKEGVRITEGATGNDVVGNVISGNALAGVGIDDADGNAVRGNLIGTDRTGLKAIANDVGVNLSEADGNLVRNNVISGNLEEGVVASGVTTGSKDNRIEANRIGVGADGAKALGNGQEGVLLDFAFGTVTRDNVIGHNGQEGVALTGIKNNGNFLTRNRIFANGRLGIDLDKDGPNPTTVSTGLGPNGLQTAPVITNAVARLGHTAVNGVLTSTPNRTFRVEFFASSAADPSGFGEGGLFLGAVTVTTNAQGHATFHFVLSRALKVGSVVSATATRVGDGGTSEFSNARKVTAG